MEERQREGEKEKESIHDRQSGPLLHFISHPSRFCGRSSCREIPMEARQVLRDWQGKRSTSKNKVSRLKGAGEGNKGDIP